MCSGLLYYSTRIINSCELQKPLWKKKTTIKYHYTLLTGMVYEGAFWGLALFYNLTSVAVTQMHKCENFLSCPPRIHVPYLIAVQQTRTGKSMA